MPQILGQSVFVALLTWALNFPLQPAVGSAYNKALPNIVTEYERSGSALGMQTGSQCFNVKGVPTLKLKCPGGHMIRVHQSFFGVAPDNATCAYSSDGNHCIQLADMQHNCMGRYMCYVYVSNPFLMSCRTYAEYMQINYTCVPKTDAIDMCGLSTQSLSRGYLRSPNYPDANYTNNLHCQCHLSTSDSGINLQVLDFDVHHSEVKSCESDHVAISGWGKKCGLIRSDKLPQTLSLRRQQVSLEFHTGSKRTGRGFWLQFTGSQSGPVTVSCKSFSKPSPTSSAGSDHDSDAEHGLASETDSDYEDDAQVRHYAGDTKLPPVKNNIFPDIEKPVLIEDTGSYPAAIDSVADSSDLHPLSPDDKVKVVQHAQGTKKEDENDANTKHEFDSYDFSDSQESYGMNSIDKVQIATGTVVGVLILTAVIIIIVLVFRR